MMYHNPGASVLQPSSYRIRIRGILDKQWSEYCRGMTIEHARDAHNYTVTILMGRLMDQSALVGILNSLHDMGCPILLVERIEAK